ncbi:MAG: hypothetical protein MUP24_09010 [Gillisia sp.]|nr:hypothetical protein [Gillisia sp.]
MKKKEKKWDLAPTRPFKRTEGIMGLYIDLSTGRRKPANDYEREILKEIEEIEAKGGMIDLPFI